MSTTAKSKKCTCNVPNQTKQVRCINCRTEWTESLGNHEILSNCPEHHDSIAICSGPCNLCSDCRIKGYTARPGFGFSPPTLMKDGIEIEIDWFKKN